MKIIQMFFKNYSMILGKQAKYLLIEKEIFEQMFTL